MSDQDRHSRHRRFHGIGDRGQIEIASARIAIAGCGALGSRVAELLARSGVGTAPRGLLRIVDRDYVEVSNLQRQALFDDDDARQARPKALAAELHIRRIDPSVRCDAHVRDLSPANAERLLDEVDLIVDGTDNFRTRLLLNDVSLARRVPWVHGAAVASRGSVAGFIPTRGPCYRCLLGNAPNLGAGETCDTAGIVAPLPSLVASMQAAFVLRWIVDGTMPAGMRFVEIWGDEPGWRTLFEDAAPDPECRSCGRGDLPALREEHQEVVTLCGRNSVQIVTARIADLDRAERRLRELSPTIHRHARSVTARLDSGALTLFDDGRIIVEGTTDPHEATSLVARCLGG
ncbi:MAG TPA: ThiF family adenylyltransferase [Thermoanaerobaculia bacterium]|nr:ThiF family adenylyltransferase [Thermoanaerobaculia bacterium]